MRANRLLWVPSPWQGVRDNCPVSGFDPAAIEWSLPPKLRELDGYRSASTGAPLDAVRVWSTLLSSHALLRLEESFLLHTQERDGFEETIVDRGMAWLEKKCDEHPHLARAYPELSERAVEYLEAWELVRDATITQSRLAWNADKENKWTVEKQKLQALMAGTVMKAHETFSVLFSPPTEWVLSWQKAFVICTALVVRPASSPRRCCPWVSGLTVDAISHAMMGWWMCRVWVGDEGFPAAAA